MSEVPQSAGEAYIKGLVAASKATGAPETSRPAALVLLGQLDRPLALRLGALMIASALTEALGVVLLVPLLGLLGPGGGTSGAGARITGALSRLGLVPTPTLLLLLFAGIVILRAVLNHARAMASLLLQVKLVDGLRTRAWQALLACDWRVVSRVRQSRALSLLVTSIEQIGGGLFQLIGATTSAVTLGGLALAAIAISPLVVVAALLGGGAILIAYRRLRRQARLLGARLTTAYEALHGQLGEGLRGLRLVKSLGIEHEMTDAVDEAIGTLRGAQIAFQRNVGLSQIAIQGGGAVLLALALWFAVGSVQLRLEVVLPLVAMAVRALPLVGVFQECWQNWSHTTPALEEAMALIAEVEAAREPHDAAVASPELAREMRFSGVKVSFDAEGPAALAGVDLTIAAGETVALLGPSGAGKSTLADLAGGLLSPDAGAVCVDGVMLTGPARQAWRRRVAYVQQEAILLRASLRENLRVGAGTADDARIGAALAAASAGFVERLPEGLDTVVGDGGRRLSGGEQQRVALARALMREPRLLILDEATSALDAANEAAIVDAVRALKGRMTILIIGHRGSLVDLADRTVRLAHGRIVTIRDNPAG